MFNRRVFMGACTSLLGLVTHVFGKVRREPPAQKGDFVPSPTVAFTSTGYPLIQHLPTATFRSMVNEMATLMASDVSIEYPSTIGMANNDDPDNLNIYPVTVRIGRLIGPQAAIDSFHQRYSDVLQVRDKVLIIEEIKVAASLAVCVALTSPVFTLISRTIQSDGMVVQENLTMQATFSPVNRLRKMDDVECLTVSDGRTVRSFVHRSGSKDVMTISRTANMPIPLGFDQSRVAIFKALSDS